MTSRISDDAGQRLNAVGSFSLERLSPAAGSGGAVEVEVAALLPVSSGGLFALSLFVCGHVFHGGMRQQARA